MEKHVEKHADQVKSNNGIFLLLGTVFGALTGGFTQETFGGTLIGAVIGLLFAAFFVSVLLKGREHDR